MASNPVRRLNAVRAKGLEPDLVLKAYARGLFPMAQSASDRRLHWMDPSLRGVFDLGGFHISRSLRHHILRADYKVTVNRDFAAVMRACADRPLTWINGAIHETYCALHTQGAAHSVEVWQDGILAGGVYGVQIGAAFCGESMFSRRRDASKTALAWLMHRLRAGGFSLFDTQYLTPHLASVGAIEITRADYHDRLSVALARSANFEPPLYQPSASDVVSGSATGVVGVDPSSNTQVSTHTS